MEIVFGSTEMRPLERQIAAGREVPEIRNLAVAAIDELKGNLWHKGAPNAQWVRQALEQVKGYAYRLRCAPYLTPADAYILETADRIVETANETLRVFSERRPWPGRRKWRRG